MPIDSSGDYISHEDLQIRADAQKAAHRALNEGGYRSPEHAAADCGRYNGVDLDRFRREFNKAMKKG